MNQGHHAENGDWDQNSPVVGAEKINVGFIQRYIIFHEDKWSIGCAPVEYSNSNSNSSSP